MDDVIVAILMIGVTIGIIVASIIFYNVEKQNIESNQPIKPTIKIVTENGISDTTYIYRR